MIELVTQILSYKIEILNNIQTWKRTVQNFQSKSVIVLLTLNNNWSYIIYAKLLLF